MASSRALSTDRLTCHSKQTKHPDVLGELTKALSIKGLASRFSWRGLHDRIMQLGDGIVVSLILSQLNAEWSCLQPSLETKDVWPPVFFEALAGLKTPDSGDL